MRRNQHVPLAQPPALRRAKSRGLDADQYTAEELDVLRAVDRYKRLHHRPNPTITELLAVLKSLGYRRVASAVDVQAAA